ncbi:hypothetical protein [Robertmurraya siralis]|uniref:hypothetical protein n=1 Tax=Robertmurraya siralis TaxID=77777 RepID=UPI0010FA342C|nr:hypothetical protein [Robertmurraya siralis]
MSSLFYTSKSHSKTVELIQKILNEANRKRNGTRKGTDFLTIEKNAMTEYHMGYIIEKLEENGFEVRLSQGNSAFNLTIKWDNNLITSKETLQEIYEELSKGDLFNLLTEAISQKEKAINALKEIESLTMNPREYEPSIYSINHIARVALNKKGN